MERGTGWLTSLSLGAARTGQWAQWVAFLVMLFSISSLHYSFLLNRPQDVNTWLSLSQGDHLVRKHCIANFHFFLDSMHGKKHHMVQVSVNNRVGYWNKMKGGYICNFHTGFQRLKKAILCLPLGQGTDVSQVHKSKHLVPITGHSASPHCPDGVFGIFHLFMLWMYFHNFYFTWSLICKNDFYHYWPKLWN